MKSRASLRVGVGLALCLASAGGTAMGQAAAVQDPADAVTALTRDPGAFVRFDGQKVIRATAKTQRDVLTLTTLSESVWSEASGIGDFDVQIKAERLANLDELGIAYRVLIDDVQARVEAERAEIIAASMQRDIGWFAAYKTRTEINSYMDVLAAGSGGLAVTETLPGATTIGGRTIKAIRITGPDAPGNPKATRPAVLYNGCQHAREWVSPMTIMYFAERLLSSYATDARVKGIVDNCEIILVPIVNPDGYEFTWSNNRMWRKNRRNNGDGSFGVDNNRNWAFQWGGEGASATPSNDTYRGPSAASEVETQNLANYISSIPRIKAHIDFHSYSQLVMSPWAWTAALPVDHAVFMSLNQQMTEAIESVYGMDYTYGPIYTTIYPASGGACDWTYGAKGILGFSIELRDLGANGFLLPADQIIPTGEENYRAIEVLTEYVAYPFTFSWPGGSPPVSVAADTSNVVQLNIMNASGAVNPATAVMWFRVGSDPFVSTPLTSVGGTLYEATIPATGCGQTIELYAEATSTEGRTLQFPAGGATSPAAIESLTTLVLFNDACESNIGWSLSVGDDNATTGRWELAAPVATGYQPGSDHSAVGTRCYVTDGRGGADGNYDIDNGKTTLTSPTFSGVAPEVQFTTFEAHSSTLAYWRWYGVTGADTMPVEVSTNGGSSWSQLELVSGNQLAWSSKAFQISSPTANMKLRFTARDDNPQTLVEAAVDDVSMKVVGCRWSYADINRDGQVDLNDFFDFLNCFDQNLPCGDVNGDTLVDLTDFFDFLNAFDVAG